VTEVLKGEGVEETGIMNALSTRGFGVRCVLMKYLEKLG
jgi:hypothetical protein